MRTYIAKIIRKYTALFAVMLGICSSNLNATSVIPFDILSGECTQYTLPESLKYSEFELYRLWSRSVENTDDYAFEKCLFPDDEPQLFLLSRLRFDDGVSSYVAEQLNVYWDQKENRWTRYVTDFDVGEPPIFTGKPYIFMALSEVQQTTYDGLDYTLATETSVGSFKYFVSWLDMQFEDREAFGNLVEKVPVLTSESKLDTIYQRVDFLGEIWITKRSHYQFVIKNANSNKKYVIGIENCCEEAVDQILYIKWWN